jgi:hypothetical protein
MLHPLSDHLHCRAQRTLGQIHWTDVHISKAGSAGTTGTAGCQRSSETAEKEQMVSEEWNLRVCFFHQFGYIL